MKPGIRSSLSVFLEEALAPMNAVGEGRAMLETFGAEADAYGEAILSPNGRVAGFMIRGEGAEFTERAAAVLAAMQLPEAARAHHRRLAHLMGHRRGFLKLEWHHREGQEPERLAAFYHRRRPEVWRVLEFFDELGVAESVRGEIELLARTLEKETVHFVAAAARAGQPGLHHKLYFSQYVTPDRLPGVTTRIGALMAPFGVSPEMVETWRPVHEAILGERETTLFASINFTLAERKPWLKLDYPEVKPEVIQPWIAPQDQETARREMGHFIRTAGLRRMSYLGVRLSESPLPQLKYYADPRGA
ncbi:MAG: hypothetical protein ACE366_26645 [Bradymonadia bacterium]